MNELTRSTLAMYSTETLEEEIRLRMLYADEIRKCQHIIVDSVSKDKIEHAIRRARQLVLEIGMTGKEYATGIEGKKYTVQNAIQMFANDVLAACKLVGVCPTAVFDPDLSVVQAEVEYDDLGPMTPYGQALRHLREMIDGIQWMSGSGSFSEKGEAHDGWIRLRKKMIDADLFLEKQLDTE